MEKFMSLDGVGDLYMGEVFEYYDGPKLFTLNKKNSELSKLGNYSCIQKKNRTIQK